jgi:hypothetical protein
MDWRAPRDERLDVQRKAAEWRDATYEERDRASAAACRAAAAMLAERPDRERILSWREPPPADTLAILARLRAEARPRKGKPH